MWQAHQAERARKRAPASPNITYVKVIGVDEDEARLIRTASGATPGQAVDVKDLELSLAYLTGSDRYDTIGYRLEYTDGQPGLVLDVTPKSYAPPFLYLAFDLQNIDSNSFSADFRGRTVFTDVVNAGSELTADFSVGTNQYVGAELFLPVGRTREFATLGGGRFFFMPRAYFSRESVNGYDDDELVAEYTVKTTGAGFDVGFTSGRRNQVRLGYDTQDVRGRLRIGSPLLPEVEGANRFASLRYTFDGFTTPVVPTRGANVEARLSAYFDAPQPTSPVIAGLEDFALNEFWQGEVSYWHFFRVRGTDRVFYNLSGGTSFGDEPKATNVFRLGGPFRLGSFNQDELRGPNYLLASTGYLHELFRLPDFLGGGVLAGAWLESGSTFEKLDQAKFEFSGTAGIIAETLLGPMFGGLSTGSNGGLQFYVALRPLLGNTRRAGQ